MVPGEQVTDQVEVEIEVCDDAYVGVGDIEQNQDLSIAPEKEPPLLDMNVGRQSNCEYSGYLVEDDKKPIIGGREYLNDLELPDNQKHVVDSLENNMMDSKLESNDYRVDRTNSMSFQEADYLLDEPYFNATSNPIFGDGFFLETNDLLENNDMDALNFDMVERCLSFSDGDDNNIAFNSSEVITPEEPFLNQLLLLLQKNKER